MRVTAALYRTHRMPTVSRKTNARRQERASLRKEKSKTFYLTHVASLTEVKTCGRPSGVIILEA
jgi:hypothetical protein